jgi:hypothetical protein
VYLPVSGGTGEHHPEQNLILAGLRLDFAGKKSAEFLPAFTLAFRAGSAATAGITGNR